MTANRIKDLALAHFAKNGYEGASLADIAMDVGIKKQSIYTHFKGKDELFLEVYNNVLTKELNFVSQYLDNFNNLSAEQFLHGFLLQYKERYEQDDNTKFFLRMSFFPPAHLYDKVAKFGCNYVDSLETLLIPVIDKAILEGNVSPSISSERAIAAFMAVLDGMFVEMLYGNTERALKRIDASWFVYWRGLKI